MALTELSETTIRSAILLLVGVQDGERIEESYPTEEEFSEKFTS